MKRIGSALLAAVLIMGVLSSCGDQPSYEAICNDVVDVTKTDAFGEHSIVILGDSMSHGAATGDIPNNSWVGLVKKAVNAQTGDHNYGFTSIEGTLWSNPKSHELHAFPETPEGFKNRGEAGKGWTEYRTAELLGTKGLGSSVKDATLIVSPKERFAYFCVYYEAGARYGTFDVCDSAGNVLLSVDASTGDGYTRTEMIDMTVLPEDNKIVLKATSDKEIIFTGIGYYNTPDGVVISNYSNGGLEFAGIGLASNGDMTGLDNTFIDLATTSGTLIFALGFNDSHGKSDYDLFVEKMDYLIEKAKENGTKIIVNDLCWDFSTRDNRYLFRYPRLPKFKEQLKRLAEETGGIYVDQQAIHGDAILDTIADGAHPNAEGHMMIADAMLEAMRLTEATE